MQADARHRRLEFFSVLCFVYGFARGANHFDAVALEYAVSGEIERAIECRH